MNLPASSCRPSPPPFSSRTVRRIAVGSVVGEAFASLDSFAIDDIGLPGIDMVVLSPEHLDHIGATFHFTGKTIIAAHRLAANKIMLRDDFSTRR
jgi:glyoxylase-like metal-dependent hydrolase (beta-lactamase superfamily II)